MSACHDCLFVFIYLSIYFFFITIVIYFPYVYKFSDAQFFVTLSVRVLYLWDTDLRTEDRTFKYVEICFLALFFLLFFSITLCNKLCYSDHASFLDGFYDSLAGVLFFYYSLHKLQYQIKNNIKITFLRVKIENKNLNAILDSKNFKIQKFEKRGRAMAQLNGTSHGLRSFPKLRVLGIW